MNKINAQESIDNLRDLFDKATPDDVIAGMVWYDKAHADAVSIANETGLDLKVVVSVIAALSPRCKWDRNVVDARKLCQAFVAGWDARTVTVTTFDPNKDQAVQILETGNTDLLTGAKRVPFAHCVHDPHGSEVCIDSHAYNALLGYRAISNGKGPRVTMARARRATAAYTDLAVEKGVSPMQGQAILWVAWKRIHDI